MSLLILNILLCGIILFEIVILTILLSNLIHLRPLGAETPPDAWPVVSILVPARNEAHNIEACIQSLLRQNYANFQVVALDDHSTDDTWQILSRLAKDRKQMHIIKGTPLPSDWLGKHWACHQLAQAATGDLLLFTDADTRHQPDTLSAAVSTLLVQQADLLTAMPLEEVGSWAERLIVPIIPWSIFSFVPLKLAYHLQLPILSATVGQFMLFRRLAYDQIGGYPAIRANVVDDLTLGRRIKAHGLCWRLADGTNHIRCRMYTNFQEVIEGLSKNLFATFDNKVGRFLFIWLWLAVAFSTPWLVIAADVVTGSLPAITRGAAITAIFLAGVSWGLSHRRFGFAWYLTFCYPATILLSVVIALRSLMLGLTKQATWKGRALYEQKLR